MRTRIEYEPAWTGEAVARNDRRQTVLGQIGNLCEGQREADQT